MYEAGAFPPVRVNGTLPGQMATRHDYGMRSENVLVIGMVKRHRNTDGYTEEWLVLSSSTGSTSVHHITKWSRCP